MQSEAAGDVPRGVAEVFGPCGAAASWDSFAPQPLCASPDDCVQLLEAVAPGLARGLQLLAQHPAGPIFGWQQQPAAAATLLLLASSVESCFTCYSKVAAELREQLNCELAAVATRAGIVPALSQLCSVLANSISSTPAATFTAATSAVLGGGVVAPLVLQLAALFSAIAGAWPGRQLFASPALAPAAPAVASLLVAALRNNAACVQARHGWGGTADVAFGIAWCLAHSLRSGPAARNINPGPEAALLLMALGLAAQRLHQQQQGWPDSAGSSSQQQQQQQQQQPSAPVPAHHQRLLRWLAAADGAQCSSLAGWPNDMVADIIITELWRLGLDACTPPHGCQRSISDGGGGQTSGSSSRSGGIDYAQALAEQQQQQVWTSARAAAVDKVMLILPVVMEVMALQPTPKMVGAGLAALERWTFGAGGSALLAAAPEAASDLLLMLLQLAPPAVAQAQHAADSAPSAAAAAAPAADAAAAAPAADAAAAAPAAEAAAAAPAAEAAAAAPAAEAAAAAPAADAAAAAPAAEAAAAAPAAEAAATAPAAEAAAAVPAAGAATADAAADAAGGFSLRARMNGLALWLAGAAVSAAINKGQGLSQVAGALRQGQQQCSVAFEAHLRWCNRHSSAADLEPISFFIQQGSDFDLQLFSLMVSCLKAVTRAAGKSSSSSSSSGSGDGHSCGRGYQAQPFFGILKAVFYSCRIARGSSCWLPMALAARCCVPIAAALQQQEWRPSPEAVRDLFGPATACMATVSWLSQQAPAIAAAQAAATAVQTGPGLQQLLQEQAPPLQQQLACISSSLVAVGASVPGWAQAQSPDSHQAWQQLEAFGAAVAAQLPLKHCCNFHGCVNSATDSELELVSGRACVCSGCNTARYCSRECQVAHYKGWHKAVCRHIASQRQQQQQQQQQLE